MPTMADPIPRVVFSFLPRKVSDVCGFTLVRQTLPELNITRQARQEFSSKDRPRARGRIRRRRRRTHSHGSAPAALPRPTVHDTCRGTAEHVLQSEAQRAGKGGDVEAGDGKSSFLVHANLAPRREGPLPRCRGSRVREESLLFLSPKGQTCCAVWPTCTSVLRHLAKCSHCDGRDCAGLPTEAPSRPRYVCANTYLLGPEGSLPGGGDALLQKSSFVKFSQPAFSVTLRVEGLIFGGRIHASWPSTGPSRPQYVARLHIYAGTRRGLCRGAEARFC